MKVNFKKITYKEVDIDFQKIFDFINSERDYPNTIDIAHYFAYNSIYCLLKTHDLDEFSLHNDENNDIIDDIENEFYNWIENKQK